MKGYKIVWSDKNKFKTYYPEYVWLDSEMMFGRGFCEDCEAIKRESDINFASCPAGYDCVDENCIRHEYVEEIAEIVNALNQRIDELCKNNTCHVNIFKV